MIERDGVSETTSPVILHLVHGTWPHGLWGSPGKVKAWFEEGSPVRAAIVGASEAPVVLRELPWSGRNSAVDRRAAARALLNQIEASIAEYPQSSHVVVAHSHGGTVAADALSMLRIPPGTPRIKALVCMATPFAYCVPREDSGRFNGAIATCLATALSIFWVWWKGVPFGLAGWGLFGFWLAAIATTHIAMVLLVSLTGFVGRDVYKGAPIDRRIKTFIIRATRDEAAFVLGLTQAFNRFGTMLFRVWDGMGESWSGTFAACLLIATAAPLAAVASVVVLSTIGLPYSSGIYFEIMGLILLSFAVAAGHVLGSTVDAISAGIPLRYCASYIVEVDSAPPETECYFKAYSDIGEKAPGLRHGIYSIDAVQKEVGRLVGRVWRGEPPRLLRHDELEQEENLSNPYVVGQLNFVRTTDLIWVEEEKPAPGYVVLPDHPQDGQSLASVPLAELAQNRRRKVERSDKWVDSE